MSIEVKNSVQETIKNLEAQEQTPETMETISALKEAFNTEVVKSVAEFKAEDGEMEKIEQSVNLKNPESVKEVEGEMKVEETLQGFDVDAENIQKETLENNIESEEEIKLKYLINRAKELDQFKLSINDTKDHSVEYSNEDNESIVKDLFNLSEILEKIENKEYGLCEVCSAYIEEDRLMANSSARTCKVHMNE